jgi:ArsR family transcriptional regulator
VDSSTALAPTGVESTRLLAVVSDPIRWSLLAVLADGQTRCVCDLRPAAGVAANLLSYHLKVLRDTGLVRARRRGRWVDYTIAQDALERLHTAIPRPGAAAGFAVPARLPEGARPAARRETVGSGSR